MARKSNDINVLQFDERVISLLRARPAGRGIEVADFEQQRGEWSAEDRTLAEALRQFVKTHRVADGRVFSVLPRHNMTTRILTMPSHEPAEIADMVRLSAEEFAPYPAHELVIDQTILQSLPDGQARVFAVFVHHEVVDAHVRLLRAAGVEPERVFLSSACLASAAIASHQPAPDAERYALVNLASGGFETLAFRNAQLEYVRGLVTAQDWACADEVMEAAAEELGLEVRASLSTYRRESDDGLGIEALFVASDYAATERWSQALEGHTGYSCAPADFARDLCAQGAEKLPFVPLVSIGAALTALDRAKVAINLTPASLTTARRRADTRTKLLWAACAIGLVALGALLVYGQAIHQRAAYLHRLQSQIDALEPEAKAIATKQNLLRIVEHQVDQRGAFLELFAEMCKAAPPSGINILSFHYTHRDSIVVDGTALSDLQVNQWQDSLRAAGKNGTPEFAEAQNVKTASGDKVHNTEVVNYRLSIPFPASATDGAEKEPGGESSAHGGDAS